MEELLLARISIMNHTKDQVSVSGVIDCPVCKKENSLNFAVSSNGHIHAKCDTDGCVRWME